MPGKCPIHGSNARGLTPFRCLLLQMFCADLGLILSNCIEYNGEDEDFIVPKARKLVEVCVAGEPCGCVLPVAVGTLEYSAP